MDKKVSRLLEECENVRSSLRIMTLASCFVNTIRIIKNGEIVDDLSELLEGSEKEVFEEISYETSIIYDVPNRDFEIIKTENGNYIFEPVIEYIEQFDPSIKETHDLLITLRKQIREIDPVNYNESERFYQI